MKNNTRSSGVVPPRLVAICCLLVTAAVVFSTVIAASYGAVQFDLREITEVIGSKLWGSTTEIPKHSQQIIWDLRLPRVLLAGIVGAGLSLAGVAVQGLVRNPIADPYVLGVSSGASVGAAFVLLFGSALSFLGGAEIAVAAFITALIAMLLVYYLAQNNGRLEPVRLVLVGVVLSYVFSGITSFMVFRGDPRASQTVMFWLLGSFGRARWSMLLIPLIVTCFALFWLFFRAKQMDAILVGDEAATTLGVRVEKIRFELFALTAALTAVMVAVSGAVAFVGLVIPHISRLLVGSLHRRLFPMAALMGSLFMIWVDLGARYLAAPQEVPLGVLTSLIGGPVFVFLMRQQQRRRAR